MECSTCRRLDGEVERRRAEYWRVLQIIAERAFKASEAEYQEMKRELIQRYEDMRAAGADAAVHRRAHLTRKAA